MSRAPSDDRRLQHTGTSPEFSVVIPTRNRCSFLQRSLRAALNQEEVDVEVVVVDDGSTDGTADWLAAHRPERVRVVRHEEAAGQAQARNAGIRECRGQWVAFLDDDDVWSPGKLRAQREVARRDQASWVYAGVVVVDTQLQPRALMPFPDPLRLSRDILAAQVVPAGASNVIVSRELLRDAGGIDERLDHLADWDLWIRLACLGTVSATPSVLVAYVEHAGNKHAAPDLDEVFSELEYVREKHRMARQQTGVEIDAGAFVRWAAWGHRRAGRRWRAATLQAQDALRRRDPGGVKDAARALLGTRPLRWWRQERPPEPEWLQLYR